MKRTLAGPLALLLALAALAAAGPARATEGGCDCIVITETEAFDDITHQTQCQVDLRSICDKDTFISGRVIGKVDGHNISPGPYITHNTHDGETGLGHDTGRVVVCTGAGHSWTADVEVDVGEWTYTCPH